MLRDKLSHILMVVFILIIAQAGFAEPQELIISDVKVVGNRTVTDTEVMSTVRSRAGQVFNMDIAEADTKRIAELSGVEYFLLQHQGCRQRCRADVCCGRKEYRPGDRFRRQ